MELRLQDRQVLLFDLDGTLTDSQEGITRSVAYALEGFGIHETDMTSLRRFIGPPLDDSFQEYYGFSLEQAKAATARYRQRYNVTGWMENQVYPGIPELLQGLRDQGRKLLVATSKPTPTTLDILEYFDLRKYFMAVAGSEFDGTRSTKAQVVRYALELAGEKDPNRAVMIGDRRHDVLGAREAGLDCVGVLYGFGDRAELETAGAVWIAPTVQDLGRQLGLPG